MNTSTTRRKATRKLLPINSLVKKVWQLYSQWLRLAYANNNGMCMCVTCGYWFHWKRLQAGHYIHRRSSIKFDFRNVHPQCEQCNGYKDGSPREYALFLVNRYGASVLEELHVLACKPFRWQRPVLDQMVEELRVQIRQLGEKPVR